ncbi:MAG: hypothetical protein JKY53_09980 [Flavobacteriales bacterium]|nr:hypothetical protein [Flavobacteriales bacterium]
MRRILFVIICSLSSYQVSSQNQDLSKQIPKEDSYAQFLVVDSINGITMYETLNYRTGGDSIRNDKGYAANGWKKDYYTSDKILHKGFYVDGQLKTYRNYYPNGDIERIFNIIDDFKSIMKTYYKGDILKSQIKYVKFKIKKQEEFFPNGFLKHYEEYAQEGNYHIIEKHYYKTGQLKSLFELTSRETLKYTTKEFHENGTIKAQGASSYRRKLMSYLKIDTWKYFDKSGKLIKEEIYVNGKVNKETSY